MPLRRTCSAGALPLLPLLLLLALTHAASPPLPLCTEQELSYPRVYPPSGVLITSPLQSVRVEYGCRVQPPVVEGLAAGRVSFYSVGAEVLLRDSFRITSQFYTTWSENGVLIEVNPHPHDYEVPLRVVLGAGAFVGAGNATSGELSWDFRAVQPDAAHQLHFERVHISPAEQVLAMDTGDLNLDAAEDIVLSQSGENSAVVALLHAGDSDLFDAQVICHADICSMSPRALQLARLGSSLGRRDVILASALRGRARVAWAEAAPLTVGPRSGLELSYTVHDLPVPIAVRDHDVKSSGYSVAWITGEPRFLAQFSSFVLLFEPTAVPAGSVLLTAADVAPRESDPQSVVSFVSLACGDFTGDAIVDCCVLVRQRANASDDFLSAALSLVCWIGHHNASLGGTEFTPASRFITVLPYKGVNSISMARMSVYGPDDVLLGVDGEDTPRIGSMRWIPRAQHFTYMDLSVYLHASLVPLLPTVPVDLGSGVCGVVVAVDSGAGLELVLLENGDLSGTLAKTGTSVASLSAVSAKEVVVQPAHLDLDGSMNLLVSSGSHDTLFVARALLSFTPLVRQDVLYPTAPEEPRLAYAQVVPGFDGLALDGVIAVDMSTQSVVFRPANNQLGSLSGNGSTVVSLQTPDAQLGEPLCTDLTHDRMSDVVVPVFGSESALLWVANAFAPNHVPQHKRIDAPLPISACYLARLRSTADSPLPDLLCFHRNASAHVSVFINLGLDGFRYVSELPWKLEGVGDAARVLDVAAWDFDGIGFAKGATDVAVSIDDGSHDGRMILLSDCVISTAGDKVECAEQRTLGHFSPHRLQVVGLGAEMVLAFTMNGHARPALLPSVGWMTGLARNAGAVEFAKVWSISFSIEAYDFVFADLSSRGVVDVLLFATSGVVLLQTTASGYFHDSSVLLSMFVPESGQVAMARSSLWTLSPELTLIVGSHGDKQLYLSNFVALNTRTTILQVAPSQDLSRILSLQSRTRWGYQELVLRLEAGSFELSEPVLFSSTGGSTRITVELASSGVTLNCSSANVEASIHPCMTVIGGKGRGVRIIGGVLSVVGSDRPRQAPLVQVLHADDNILSQRFSGAWCSSESSDLFTSRSIAACVPSAVTLAVAVGEYVPTGDAPTLSLHSSTIDPNAALPSLAACLIVRNGTSLFLHHLSFSGCHNQGRQGAGALAVDNMEELTIALSEFGDSSAVDANFAGCLSSSSTVGTLQLNRVHMQRCTNANGVGGLRATRSDMVLEDCTFRDCSGESCGAAELHRTTAQLHRTSFVRNSALRFGGSMCLRQADVSFSGLLVANGTAREGGGLVVTASTVAIDADPSQPSLFFNLDARDGGGAILCDSSSLVVRSTSFVYNSGVRGGAIRALACFVRIADVHARDNFAYEVGGFLHAAQASSASPASLQVTNCSFETNRAEQGGGGVMFVSDLPVAMDTVAFVGNYALYGGALVFNSADRPPNFQAHDLVCNNNSALLGNGGCAAFDFESKTVSLKAKVLFSGSGTRARGNYASQGGGFVYWTPLTFLALPGTDYLQPRPKLDGSVPDGAVAGNNAQSGPDFASRGVKVELVLDTVSIVNQTSREPFRGELAFRLVDYYEQVPVDEDIRLQWSLPEEGAILFGTDSTATMHEGRFVFAEGMDLQIEGRPGSTFQVGAHIEAAYGIRVPPPLFIHLRSCREGEFEENESRCSLCPAGRFSTNTSAASGVPCTLCPPTTVAPERGAPACQQCALPFEFRNSPGRVVCRSCSPSDYPWCRPNDPAVPSCDPYGQADDLLARGEATIICAACPDNARCDTVDVPPPVTGLSPDLTPTALASDGWWLDYDRLGRARTFACPNRAACKGGGCGKHRRWPPRENPVCGHCESGYYEWSGECVDCPDEPRYAVFFGLWLASLAFFVVFHIMVQSTSGTLASIVYFAQIALVLTLETGVHTEILELFNSSVFDSTGAYCLAPLSPIDKVLWGLVGSAVSVLNWVLLATAAWLCPPLRRLRCFGGDDSDVRWTAVLGRTLVGVFVLTYNATVGVALSYFNCVDVQHHGDGVSVLYSHPAVSCSDAAYRSLRPWMVTLAVVELLVIPCCLFAAVFHARRDPSRKQARYVFGVLTDHYRSGRSLWEFWSLSRRTALVMVSVFLRPHWTERLAMLGILNLIVLLVHSLGVPFRERVNNLLESASLFVLCVLSALVPTVDRNTSGVSSGPQVAVLVIIVLTLCGLATAVAYRLAGRLSKHAGVLVSKLRRRLSQVSQADEVDASHELQVANSWSEPLLGDVDDSED